MTRLNVLGILISCQSSVTARPKRPLPVGTSAPLLGNVENVTIHAVHIPKTAGSAFNAQRWGLATMLPPNVLVMGGGESCYLDVAKHCARLEANKTRGIGEATRHVLVTSVRSPRAHVQSLYYQGRSEMEFKTPFENITDWLRYSAAVAAARRANQRPKSSRKFFYDPDNLQTRAFTCACRLPVGTSWHSDVQCSEVLWRRGGPSVGGPASLEVALDNMKKVYMIGPMELYLESMCLLAVKLSQRVPWQCNCSDPNARVQLKNMFPRLTPRKLEPHHLSDLSSEDLELIDSLTQNDSVLYNATASRFQAEILDAERAYGVPLLCNPVSFRPSPPVPTSLATLAAPPSSMASSVLGSPGRGAPWRQMSMPISGNVCSRPGAAMWTITCSCFTFALPSDQASFEFARLLVAQTPSFLILGAVCFVARCASRWRAAGTFDI